MQEGGPEAVGSAAVEQLDGGSEQPRSLRQAAEADAEQAPQVYTGLDQDLSGAERSAGPGGHEDGDASSGSISDAAGEATADGRAGVMAENSAADASNAPSSSNNTLEPRTEASYTCMRDAGAADSGRATVKPSRRKVKRQVENTVPTHLHQATAAAPLVKPLPLPSASCASGHRARLPEALQHSHDTQVRL